MHDLYELSEKTQFALILYTKSHFGAIFSPTCMYTMFRNFGTVPRPRANLGVKMCGELVKKIVIKCRDESFARCRVIARYVEGGHHGPPQSN